MSTPKLYALATARADRAEDGLGQIAVIATESVGNPGEELNAVELVQKMARQLTTLREDKERLDFLITQGPPQDDDGWLTQDSWDLATMFASDGIETGAEAMRAAIDAARRVAARGAVEGGLGETGSG